VLFSTALAVFGYNQIFKEAGIGQAYPQAPSPAAPNRYLSFQARLTDSSDNPITTPTDVRFIVYNNETASGSAKLWEELRYIDPDQDGIFSVTLGTEQSIASSVFTENVNLWLGVTVEVDPEATPRQRIATVGYALNAETLQGFPPSASASADQIPVLTQEGDLVLAAASPMVYSSSGTFAIKGQALTITTDTGTNGAITIAPDGTGSLNLTGSTTTQNFIRATNANLTSGHLFSGYVGNDTATGDLLNLSSGASETEKFTVDRSGNTAIMGNLQIDGAATMSAFRLITSPAANYVLTSDASGNGTWADVSSTAGPWTLNGTDLYPDDNGYNVGIGTNDPSAKLHVAGQCVEENSLIPVLTRSDPALPAGRLVTKKIKDVQPGDQILSLNETAGKFEYQTVEKTLDMGRKEIYELTTETGKKIETTANHPYLARTLTENDNSQKNGNQGQGKSDSNIGINSPKINAAHSNFLSSLNVSSKQNVPSNKSIVNIKTSEKFLKPEKLGTINTAAYQAADKLTVNPDNVLNTAFQSLPVKDSFINANISQWTKVIYLRAGDAIATIDGFETIASIRVLPAQHVYDLQISNT
ncbi:hypothetical protein COW80_00760, partial [Candidatus Beckwithbacteria bacterium CG22_combo_CG10-13_8_21_14_all_01_47_9]